MSDTTEPTGHVLDLTTLRFVLELTASADKRLAGQRDEARALGRHEIANMFADQRTGVADIHSLVSTLEKTVRRAGEDAA